MHHATIYMIAGVLLIHTIADFSLQTKEQAQNKSKEFKALLYHVLTYTFTLSIFFSVILFDFKIGFIAGIANGISHLAIDFVTSKINACLYEKMRTHDLFVCVGFDQMCHIFLLILTLNFVR